MRPPQNSVSDGDSVGVDLCDGIGGTDFSYLASVFLPLTSFFLVYECEGVFVCPFLPVELILPSFTQAS